jgi:hypothetical protein
MRTLHVEHNYELTYEPKTGQLSIVTGQVFLPPFGGGSHGLPNTAPGGGGIV